MGRASPGKQSAGEAIGPSGGGGSARGGGGGGVITGATQIMYWGVLMEVLMLQVEFQKLT